ncbi:MAG: transcriptional regulator [Chloroflexi bacterium]|nr:MAG: transcriptional regulator [Chloroflexota bacterium]
MEASEVDTEQTLKTVPLFQGLRSRNLKSLARGTTARTYQPDQVIVSEGQVGYGLYIIQSGQVKVTQEGSTGSREIRRMGPGETFGEMSLLDDQPRSATVTAVEPTTALLLDKWQFVSEMKAHPEITAAMLPTLVGWLRSVELP